ncbi:hypothetical protein [Leisingera sp. M658]|uniref:hypothetical protein n=1 Tax=Leisingera sp. M658 TaxID=2867015 RepID=UPI0021A3EBD2|nr:hypothetical protein [Leisingera sp. M658]UWQ74437.1 hypothetical protein K3724_18480 [Leisingera sp. M658]
MATKLDDRNLKGVIADLPKKGFRTKFWREYRAGACKGSGVGKYMDLLEKMGVPPSGDPSKADLDQMPDIVQAFSMLANAMLKARGKCGKLQSHSRDLCLAYAKLIEKREDAAAELARNADKIKQKQMVQQLKVEKENEETDKHLEKLKKEHEETRKLILKEIKAAEVRGKKIEAACLDISKDVNAALDKLEAIKKAWKGAYNKEGADRPKIETQAGKGIRDLTKAYKIDAHAKNVKGALPKLFKELAENYKQFKQEDYNKKEYVAAGKAVTAAKRTFDDARDSVKLYATQQKIAQEEVQAARPEGV